MDEFAQNLTELIKRSGKMQKDIAEEAGIGKNTMSDYARGKRKPTPETIKRLCRALICTYEELLGRIDE